MLEDLLDQILLLSLVVTRMTGFVLFSPIYGQSSVPGLAKGCIIAAFSAAAFAGAESRTVVFTSTIGFLFLMVKELYMGFLLGFVIRLFQYVMTHAGYIMDFDMGLSMANVYDPVNGTQTAITGMILNIYYMLLFFAADGHLALMKIILDSAKAVPYGEFAITSEAQSAIFEIFKECTVTAVKLAFPLMAIELLLQVGVGIMMKVVPQINLFILNIQMKILVGFAALIFLISPLGDMIGNLITDTLNVMQRLLYLSAG